MSANNSVVIDPSPSVTVDNGGNIAFNCFAGGGPNNMFIWVRTEDLMTVDTNVQAEDSTIPIDIDGLISQFSDFILTNRSSLTINSVNITNDGGSYTCLVINEAGVGREDTILYVRPVITVQPMDVLTEAGQQVILTCLADSFPALTYQWEMMNRTTMNFDTLTGENSTSLVFSSIQFEQYGRYRCRATTPTIDVNVTSDAALITGRLIHNVQYV